MKYVFLALVLVFIPLCFSSAQVNQSVVNQEPTIDLEPSYPSPNQTFTANLNDYSLAGGATSIRWEVDGEVITSAQNARSLSLNAKAVGRSTVITATIGQSGGGSRTVRKTVTPVYLDIVLEAQTRTPSFYLGRALPSLGSTVNATAILSGYSTSQNDLLYTWRVNNTVIDGGAIRGKNRASFGVPLGQQPLLTVDITTLSGEMIMRKTITFPSVKPTILFYETSSLYGMKHKPANNLSLVGLSTSVQAEPYHLNLLTYNNPEFLEWEIDNVVSNQSAPNPYEITLGRDQGTGVSEVNFHVRSLSDLLQGGEGSFRVNY